MLCLTDTSLYIYICVKHFRMANIKYYCGRFRYGLNKTEVKKIHLTVSPSVREYNLCQQRQVRNRGPYSAGI